MSAFILSYTLVANVPLWQTCIPKIGLAYTLLHT